MVPFASATPAVDMYSGVPAGAPSAMTAVMPSARACLTMRPDWASSAPMNRTCGFAPRIVVSSGVMFVWSCGTTLAATGVSPSAFSELVNALSSPGAVGVVVGEHRDLLVALGGDQVLREGAVIGEPGRAVQEQVGAVQGDHLGGLAGGDVRDVLGLQDGRHGQRHRAFRGAEHRDVAVAGDLAGQLGADRRVALVVVERQRILRPSTPPAALAWPTASLTPRHSNCPRSL